MVNQLQLSRVQLRRLLALTLLLGLAFLGLGARLVVLQVVRHDVLAKEAESNTQYTYPLEARRGNILDCKENLLATSVFVKTVWADPVVIDGHQPEVARALAPILQMNEGELEKRLGPRFQKNKMGTNVPVHFVLIKSKVSGDDWDRIHQTMTNLAFGVNEKLLTKQKRAALENVRAKAIFAGLVDDQVRNYPAGPLAAHVIGYLGLIEQTNNGVKTQELAGVDGIERKYDAKLRGVNGWRVSERDGHEHEMVEKRSEDVAPHDGLNVVLTIDSVIQHIVETELAKGMQDYEPIAISGIVMRPRTGEILAMATLPNYDPNNPGATRDIGAFRNRAIDDLEEPGSTFKVVTVSGALNDHLVKLTDVFNCEEGHFYFGGKVLHDHKPYGMLTVAEIIAKSSNIGAAKIGIEMGEERLHEWVRAYGFGTPTGIPLPWEKMGYVRDVTNWSKLSISRIPMGQELKVTCLQMAMAMGAVANHGVLMQPMLVDRLEEQNGKVVEKYNPQTVWRVISEEADKDIITALKDVVTADGTAAAAAMTNYTVAGKTGTAQKFDMTTKTYSQEKFFASFVGFFPADNPELLIYVGIDEPRNQHNDPHQGGQTAAPIFHQIAVQAASYLNIKPDIGNPSGLPEAPQPPVVEAPMRTADAR